ncbi:MAG: hypothetical protein ACK6DZ_07130 [Acidobacteriota bacterium]
MTRRGLLGAAFVEPSFQFVHFTDPHIQLERKAAEGCRACFQKIDQLKPDFVLAGGDLGIPHAKAL